MCQLSVIRGVFKAEPETVQTNDSLSGFSAAQEEATSAKTAESGRQYDEETTLESSFSGVVRYRCNLLMRRKP